MPRLPLEPLPSSNTRFCLKHSQKNKLSEMSGKEKKNTHWKVLFTFQRLYKYRSIAGTLQDQEKET